MARLKALLEERVASIVATVAVVGCVTIGEIGGPGLTLSHLVRKQLPEELAPLFQRTPTPDKVRFGNINEGCRKHPKFACLELMVGSEIDQHPAVLRKLESVLHDPCSLFASRPQESRPLELFDYFQCESVAAKRPIKYVEIQVVDDPTRQPAPLVSKIYSYSVPSR